LFLQEEQDAFQSIPTKIAEARRLGGARYIGVI
jgi:hypothetical protein